MTKMTKQLAPINPAFWAELDETYCPCEGTGWADVNGVMTQCFIHYQGQLHPDSLALLMDEPDRLREEERKSHLRWKIEQAKQKIIEIQAALKETQKSVVNLELELINKTPTVKMQAVNPKDPVLDVDEVNWSGVFPAEAE